MFLGKLNSARGIAAMAEITAGMVKELREKTDAPMMECKKALTEAGGDMGKAEEILRVKLGNKASKAASRIAAEGVVAVHIAADGKLGLVIDVRDNGGGSTADILLASLTAPRHAYTANRGLDPSNVKRDAYPRDRRVIYGYVRPISVLINQNSFSNAEIFSHAVKTIGRGKLVGTATYGGVISTGSATLIDGTTVRTPFRGWYLPDNKDMENNGARPDFDVPMTPDAEVMGVDPQMKAAVEELLKRCENSEFK